MFPGLDSVTPSQELYSHINPLGETSQSCQVCCLKRHGLLTVGLYSRGLILFIVSIDDARYAARVPEQMRLVSAASSRHLSESTVPPLPTWQPCESTYPNTDFPEPPILDALMLNDLGTLDIHGSYPKLRKTGCRIQHGPNQQQISFMWCLFESSLVLAWFKMVGDLRLIEGVGTLRPRPL